MSDSIKQRLKSLSIALLLTAITVAPSFAQSNGGGKGTPPGDNPPAEGGPGGPGGGAGGAGGRLGRGGGQGMTPEQREARRKKMLEKFDANGDGVLDDAEKAKMRAFMEEKRAQRQAQGGGAGGAGSGQLGQRLRKRLGGGGGAPPAESGGQPGAPGANPPNSN